MIFRIISIKKFPFYHALGFGIEHYCNLLIDELKEGVNNFVSLDFLLGRFLPTVINRKPSIYNGSWAGIMGNISNNISIIITRQRSMDYTSMDSIGAKHTIL
ncbi:MAG: hypothetical protein HFJ07_09045 [Lachnospiraceae bacterium]|nr:hypothetical protein [Lachnospiraceae bacterium]